MDAAAEKRCPGCGSEYTHLNRRLGQWECEDCGHRFTGEEEGDDGSKLTISDLTRKTEHPVKIFLSYPHSSREICVMIRDALVRRGHEVWFDEEQIRAGDDWRAKIAEGIDGSRSVVSCLTRDAVRVEGGARGVCLDELSIALSTPGCVVQSVLLEPADVIEPTAAIAHRQWLDMSGWRHMRDERPEEFGSWFDRMMLELIAVVEGDESHEFAGEVEEVHDLLPFADRHMGNGELLSKPYIGREWLAEKVSAWIEDSDGGALCALWGDPGVGKSAFAAHYALRNPKVAASLRLAHGNERYNSIDAIAQSVAYQLAIRLPDYRKELLRSLRGERVDAMGPTEHVDLLFARPLAYRHIDGEHERLCVLVDGLDECGTEAGKAVALVRCLRDVLPRWLRLLVLSRPEPDIVAALRPDDEMWLRGSGDRNMADVEEYLMRGLEDAVPDEDRRKGAASELAMRSNGVFLFAEAVLGAVGEGMDPLDASSYPQTLDESLHGWFERLFPDKKEYRDKFRLPIGAMLASPAPLPEEEFNRLLGMSGAEASDLLMCMGTLLSRGEDDFERRTITVAHRYVADWLESEGAGRFRAPTGDGLRALAAGCHSIATNSPEDLTGYEAIYAIPLAHTAGMKTELQELERCYRLADRLLDLGDWLHSGGKLKPAQNLYEQALAIYDLRAKELGSAETLNELCAALERVGGLACDLGDLEEAERLYQRSLKLTEQLNSELGTSESRSWLSITLGRAGALALSRGDLDTAETRLLRSLELNEQLAEELGTPGALRSLSASLTMVGDVTKARGDLDAAEVNYARSLELLEPIVRELETPELRRNLSFSLGRVGNLARERGDLEEAERCFRRSLELDERLAEEHDTPGARRNLAISLGRVGDLARERGDLEEAERYLRHSLELEERLAEELGTPASRRNLSCTLEQISDLTLDSGNLDDTRTYRARSLELREALAEELGTPEARRDLSVSLGKAGDLAWNCGNLDAAETFYRRALELNEHLVEEIGTPVVRQDQSKMLEGIGDVARKRGDLEGAARCYARSLEQRERLAEELKTPDSQWELAISLQSAGDLAKDRGDLEEADKLFRRSTNLLERLANELGTPMVRRSLSITLGRVGELAHEHGDFDTAREHYARCIGLRYNLALELQTPGSWRDLIVALDKAGDMAYERGDLDSAEENYSQALAWQKSLAWEVNTAEMWKPLAELVLKAGDLACERGDHKTAEERYSLAVEILDVFVEKLETQQSKEELARAQKKLANVVDA